jgi:hypothetical protein
MLSRVLKNQRQGAFTGHPQPMSALSIIIFKKIILSRHFIDELVHPRKKESSSGKLDPGSSPE